MAGNKWRKLSSAALNLFRVGMDLMSGGTALYRAEAVDEKEWHLIMVLMLLMNTNNVFFVFSYLKVYIILPLKLTMN